MSPVADGQGRDTVTPISQGFRMPAEWEPHERCIIGWPTEFRVRSVWGEQFLLAKASYAAVAHAIARFEPVLMLARPGEGGVARSYCGSDIEVVEMPIDDSWMRDSGPIFVTHPDGRRRDHGLRLQLVGREVPPLRQRRRHRPPRWPSTSASSGSPPRWSSRGAASPSTDRAR